MPSGYPNPTRYPVFSPIPDPTRYWKTLPAGHWFHVFIYHLTVNIFVPAWKEHDYRGKPHWEKEHIVNWSAQSYFLATIKAIPLRLLRWSKKLWSQEFVWCSGLQKKVGTECLGTFNLPLRGNPIANCQFWGIFGCFWAKNYVNAYQELRNLLSVGR